MSTHTYQAICPECHGEGFIESSVPSMGGVGGYMLQTEGCRACDATGNGPMVTIVTECDTCDDAGLIYVDDVIRYCPDCAMPELRYEKFPAF